jgi:hypothetical protein
MSVSTFHQHLRTSLIVALQYQKRMRQRMAGVREISASLQVPTKARASLHLDRRVRRTL